jgi:hypothetical protein
MQVETPSPPVKRQARWKLALNISLPIILLAIFAWQFRKDWPAIKLYHWHISWTLALLSLLIMGLNSLLETLIWNKTLGWFAEPLSFAKAVPVYIWSSLARYIPGKVASLAVRAGLGIEAGSEVVPILASSTVELALRIAGSFIMALLIFMAPGSHAVRRLMYLAFAIIPLVLFFAHPKVMIPIMNWLLCKIKQVPINRQLSYGDVLFVLAATLFRWALYGLGYTLLVRAVCGISWSHLPVLAGTGAGAWGAGFLGMSPGGLWWMEFVQRTMLHDALLLESALATMIPALFRLETLVAEGLWALAAVFMRNTWKDSVSHAKTPQPQ